MLDTLFQRSHHVRRLRANSLGPILDQYADYLLCRGHKTGVIHQFMRAAEHYGYWLGTCQAAVTADHVTKSFFSTVSARPFEGLLMPGWLPPQPDLEPGGHQPFVANAQSARPGSTPATANSARPSPD